MVENITIKRRFVHIHRWLVCVMVGLALVWIVMILRLLQVQEEKEEKLSSPFLLRSSSHTTTTTTTNSDYNFEKEKKKNTTTINNKNNNNNNCPSSSSRSSILNDLTDEQRNPTIGRRWMVRPPSGGYLYLMCCDTTKGSFNILLHEQWAPIGVKHLITMIEGKKEEIQGGNKQNNNNSSNNNKHYFDTEIPFFRCTDACQFGLSSNKTLTKQYRKSIPDDPLWLPTGSSNRKQIKRYPKGVLTHAGAGNNSRSVQFVLTLKPNKFMGGGSPWEVPLGEIVTIVDLYTGYGEKGPGQALLKREGVTDESGGVRQKWPLLDYLLQCSIVDRLIVKTERT
ncbi:cyclophilin-like protein [Fragilariopsis cylindrus CCMP1102]|uniref:Cyclophilin-like protein n=1 Tax=Fragilariopsis cylindrus CCMP1102 TaxID=635003 RepID=A0A1E7EQ03_9STRA|nr:cyclophilin-like protein [Fragilariopsis cylindrus CCMP1102]|eukprot:OEU07623.1 cyclophilin-like protein [Fragilariopsis cylindrus CCMP1102]